MGMKNGDKLTKALKIEAVIITGYEMLSILNQFPVYTNPQLPKKSFGVFAVFLHVPPDHISSLIHYNNYRSNFVNVDF